MGIREKPNIHQDVVTFCSISDKSPYYIQNHRVLFWVFRKDAMDAYSDLSYIILSAKILRLKDELMYKLTRGGNESRLS